MAGRALKDRIRAYCGRHGLLAAGDTVVIGVSGGADSVCLFLLLSELAEELALTLHTMYIDHGLRSEAAEEARYVRELSEARGAAYHTERVDVRGCVRERSHISEEEAARRLRYEALERCAEEVGAARIAVAHTRDDQAETVLYRLLRGTGLKGLGGMRARSGRVIRPLLEVSRAEVEAELSARGVLYYTDASNQSDAYARNYIRHHILAAAREVNPQAAAHIAAAAERLAEAEEYLAAETEGAYAACVREAADLTGTAGVTAASAEGAAGIMGESASEPGVSAEEAAWISGKDGLPERLCLDRAAFLALHPYLQERVLLRVLERLCGQARDLSAVHIAALRGLFTLPTGKRLDLPYRMTAVRRRTYVEVYAPGRAPYYKKLGGAE